MYSKGNKEMKSLLSKTKKLDVTKATLIIETILIFGVFSVLTKGTFLSSRNLNNILLQSCTYAIMGIGIVFVMVSGNMDLSGGSALGFICAVAAVLQVNGVGTLPTIVIMILCGLLIGAWQGFWVAYMGLPSFIVTLAGMLIFRGLCMWVGHSSTVGPVTESFGRIGSGYINGLFSLDAKNTVLLLGALVLAVFVVMQIIKWRRQSRLDVQKNFKVYLISTCFAAAGIIIGTIVLYKYRGMPYAILVLIVLALVFTYVARNTTFGRYVFAIGGNVEATKLSGVNTKKNVLSVYMLAGFLVAMAALVYLGRVSNSTASTGKDFEFTAITGCIVGGVSTLGGVGSIPYAILGIVLMSGLDTGMSLLDIDSTYQYMVRGLVLIIAVAIDVYSKRDR